MNQENNCSISQHWYLTRFRMRQQVQHNDVKQHGLHHQKLKTKLARTSFTHKPQWLKCNGSQATAVAGPRHFGKCHSTHTKHSPNVKQSVTMVVWIHETIKNWPMLMMHTNYWVYSHIMPILTHRWRLSEYNEGACPLLSAEWLGSEKRPSPFSSILGHIGEHHKEPNEVWGKAPAAEGFFLFLWCNEMHFRRQNVWHRRWVTY